MDKKQVKLALFTKESQSKTKYLAGSVKVTINGVEGRFNLSMFKNEKKTAENQPVFSGYLTLSDSIADNFQIEGEYGDRLVINSDGQSSVESTDNDDYFDL